MLMKKQAKPSSTTSGVHVTVVKEKQIESMTHAH